MHVSNDVRAAFEEWIEAGRPSGGIADWPVEKLLGALWNSSDTMPRETCESIDLPQGSSFAAAAQQLSKDHSEP